MANSQTRPSGRSSRRKGVFLLSSVLALAAAGALSLAGAYTAADYIQRESLVDVQAALPADAYGWLNVSVDGLQVHLGGTAPNEVQRFRAIARAGSVVDPGRIVDDMQVAVQEPIKTPDFEIELLRNDNGISVIGLVPASVDRKAMIEGLRKRAGNGNVSDLTETADYPVPEGWDEAFAFGMKAAELAARAKISIAVGKVSVTAITDSTREKVALTTALQRAKPEGVELVADITAPRPVIAPFTLRFVMDDQGPRFNACAADTEAARDRILNAGQMAGVQGTAACTLGLGVPTPQWADAAVPAIQAVAAMGAGSVTISDTDVALIAPASVAQTRFDEAVARLQTALPGVFTLTVQQEKASAAASGPVEFSAVARGGGVVLRGRITDDRMRAAVESIARARFGHVDSALRTDDTVPSGWTVKVIAAIEAMEGLDSGMAMVTPDLIRITGVSGSQTASDEAATQLAARLGAGARYEMSIRYDRRKDALLALPSGGECVDALNRTMKESEIGFEPAKSVIAGDPAPTLAKLARDMAECGDFRIELGGHTDSQGSEGFNARLSQQRAEAVLAAMAGHGIPVRHMTAKGYGESQPIADNDSDAGREANRRIEFTLLADEPVEAGPAPLARMVTGVTAAPDGDAAADEAPAQQNATLAKTLTAATSGAHLVLDRHEAPGDALAKSAADAPPDDKAATPATKADAVTDAPADQGGVAPANHEAAIAADAPAGADATTPDQPSEAAGDDGSTGDMVRPLDAATYPAAAVLSGKGQEAVSATRTEDGTLSPKGDEQTRFLETSSAYATLTAAKMPQLPPDLLAPVGAASEIGQRNDRPRPAPRPGP